MLSIIIPTKNRYDNLIPTLNTLKGLSGVEIIVQDNSDNNEEVVKYLDQNHFEDLKYYYDKRQMSQRENSEEALAKATRDYVTYIGDDDTVADAIVPIVEMMKKHKIECCVYEKATFRWKEVVEHNPKLNSFELCFDDNLICVKDARKELINNLQFGMQRINNLARVYHGIVSRKVLNRVKEKTGGFFPGPSPDMANAVSVCCNIEKYLYIGLPLLIDGFSYKSAGGKGLRNEHKGSLKASGQLDDDVETRWNNDIPKIWLGSTVWPQSAYEALIANKEEELIDFLGYNYIYFNIFRQYPEYRAQMKEFIKNRYISCIAVPFAKKAIGKVLDKKLYTEIDNNIQDIQSAKNRVDVFNKEKNYLEIINNILEKKEYGNF